MPNPLANYKSLPGNSELGWSGFTSHADFRLGTSAHWAAPGSLSPEDDHFLAKYKSVAASSFFGKYINEEEWNDAAPSKDGDAWVEPLRNFKAPDLAYRKKLWSYGTPEPSLFGWSESNYENTYTGSAEIVHTLAEAATVNTGTGSASPSYQALIGWDQWYGWGTMAVQPFQARVWVKNPDDTSPDDQPVFTGGVEFVDEVTADYLRSLVDPWSAQSYDTAIGSGGGGIGTTSYLTESGRKLHGAAGASVLKSRAANNLANQITSGVFTWNADYKLRLCVLERKATPIGDSLAPDTEGYYVNGVEQQSLTGLITVNKWKDDRGTFDIGEAALTNFPWRLGIPYLNDLLPVPFGKRIARGWLRSTSAAVYRVTLDVVTISIIAPGAITVHDTREITLNDADGEVFHYDALPPVFGASLRCSKVERQDGAEWTELPFPSQMITVYDDLTGEPAGQIENPDAFGHLIGNTPDLLISILLKSRTGFRWGHPSYDETEAEEADKSYYLRENFSVRKTP